MRIWLHADTHLFHQMLIDRGFRPANFGSRIERNWLRLVAADDLVVHLGDVALAAGGREAEAHALIRQLPGTHWLLIGNHDRRSVSWYLAHGWSAAMRSLTLEMFGEKILLSHKPLVWDGWYTVNIHGHFHDTDHRVHDPEVSAVLNHRHHLLALEYTRYAPVLLQSAVQDWRNKQTAAVLKPGGTLA